MFLARKRISFQQLRFHKRHYSLFIARFNTQNNIKDTTHTSYCIGSGTGGLVNVNVNNLPTTRTVNVNAVDTKIERNLHIISIWNHRHDQQMHITNSKRDATNYARTLSVEPKEQQQQQTEVHANRNKSITNQERWDIMFNHLIQYYKENGDVIVPLGYEANPKLGHWVDRQRQQYKLYEQEKPSSLNPERINELKTVGFVFDVHDLNWDSKFKELVKYKNRYGHCNVPRESDSDNDNDDLKKDRQNDYHTDDGDEDDNDNEGIGKYQGLWSWVFVQRREYTRLKNKKPSAMTQERIDALEEIGFIWSMHEQLWNMRYNELKDYKAYHGDCLVPQIFPSNQQLSKWIDVQRTQFRRLQDGKHSQLSPERMELLQKIDFVWNVHEYRWQQRFEEVEDFVRMNGHCNVPSKVNKSLCSWCRTQVNAYRNILESDDDNVDRTIKNKKLSEERIKKLKKVGLI